MKLPASDPPEKKIGLWDILEAINYSKIDMLREHPGDNTIEKMYNPYIIQRALLFSGDMVAIGAVARINAVPGVTKRQHFDYLRFKLPAKKRFGKWDKPEDSDDVDFLCEVYKISVVKAREYLALLTKENLVELREMFVQGGKGKPK